LTLGLYLRTLAPDVLPDDAGEFQVAAWRLGLAHPTGYPLYLLLGGAWQRVLAVVGISPATALNALSAVLGATAVVLFYRLMRALLGGTSGVDRLAALFAAAFLALNPTFWSQSLIAEVYTLHALLLILILHQFQKVTGGTPSQPPPVGRGVVTGGQGFDAVGQRVLPLALLIGLGLAHHATTLLVLPALVVALTVGERRWWRWALPMGVVAALPLVLYLYIPLRSGPEASPWYHQRLGEGVLTLYDQTWPAFVSFISGQSIAVGFHPPGRALANLAQARFLWTLHFTWVGLGLAAVGVWTLWRRRATPLLVLTVGLVLTQQIFNLFYAIEDILVYYIPLYLIGALWAGVGAHALAGWFAAQTRAGADNTTPADRSSPVVSSPIASSPVAISLMAVCLLLPMGLLREYAPRLDQSTATAARTQWTAILAAQPPADAILVSNDRNEIVPLFYLQGVEGQATTLTGLFPLIKPEPRFADIGATVETALTAGAGQPVYLIKPMPELAIKFALSPATPPLVRVTGLAADEAPAQPLALSFGPLQLSGYTWQPLTDTVRIALYWRVQAALPADYTTTVQLFDAAGEKLAQHDQPPGGVYYPTSLWKVGETLVERHQLAWSPTQPAARLLIGMYTGPELSQLAQPIELWLE
jgi:hypothetical protein